LVIVVHGIGDVQNANGNQRGIEGFLELSGYFRLASP
jgi:hypothetical protein